VARLTENITSTQCILEAVQHLAPEGAKGTVQKILTTRALDLTQAQGNAVLTSHGEITRSDREKHRPTSLSLHEDAGDNGERESSVNINRSALRGATAPSQHTLQVDTDSDEPIKKKPRWYKKKKIDTSKVPVPAPKLSTKAKNVPLATVRRPMPQIQTFKQNTPSQQTQVHPALATVISNNPAQAYTLTSVNIPQVFLAQPSQRQQTNEMPNSPTSNASNASKTRPIRRNEPFRISTALPENDPPLGPHCHCKAASEDPTLLPCADCGNKYHPRCIGKGRYAKGTYGGNPRSYMLKDLELFEDRPLKCGDCEEGFFGGR
jgi:hypothetical protein